jgi:hypothetical protein
MPVWIFLKVLNNEKDNLLFLFAVWASFLLPHLFVDVWFCVALLPLLCEYPQVREVYRSAVVEVCGGVLHSPSRCHVCHVRGVYFAIVGWEICA